MGAGELPAGMKRKSVWFTGPGQVEIKEEEIEAPGEGQVLVQARLSAISPGTERLFLRGLVPEDLALDGTIDSLAGSTRYPFKYGYSSVGCVTAVGAGGSRDELGQQVFCFHPHESAYLARADELVPVPEGISLEDAVLLPNMETAVNFGMDAAPLVGETVAVFGLGIVGLLTTAVLAQMPLGLLIGFDPIAERRRLAEALGGVACFDPTPDNMETVRRLVRQAEALDGFDLVVECSGSPAALDQAIALAGFEGRVVIGSWYGKKRVQLSLGGAFHRSRIRLISSQVSTIAGNLSGRWSKARRLGTAWNQIRRIQPARWITHRFPIEAACDAYQLLAENRGDAIQVVLEYPQD